MAGKMARKIFHSLIWLTLLISANAFAQTADVPTPAAEQNETFRDTLVKMRIKREEEEHKKNVTKAEQIKTFAAELLKAASANSLPRLTDKKLKDIEKNARNIRSDSGGYEDMPLEDPPDNLNATLKRLDESSEKLFKLMEKTSRHIVSVAVCAQTTEILQLTKLLRTYLR
jgi:hypothetical protein